MYADTHYLDTNEYELNYQTHLNKQFKYTLFIQTVLKRNCFDCDVTVLVIKN